jgi:hypothetical protein
MTRGDGVEVRPVLPRYPVEALDAQEGLVEEIRGLEE